jgi:hypothetical protein
VERWEGWAEVHRPIASAQAVVDIRYPRVERTLVRQVEKQHAARPKRSGDTPEHASRLVEVFEHRGEHDNVPGLIQRGRRLRPCHLDLDPVLRSRRFGERRSHLHSSNLPADAGSPAQEVASTAADLEKPAETAGMHLRQPAQRLAETELSVGIVLPEVVVAGMVEIGIPDWAWGRDRINTVAGSAPNDRSLYAQARPMGATSSLSEGRRVRATGPADRAVAALVDPFRQGFSVTIASPGAASSQVSAAARSAR